MFIYVDYQSNLCSLFTVCRYLSNFSLEVPKMDEIETSKAKYFGLVAESSVRKLDRNYYQNIIKVLLESETKQGNSQSTPRNLTKLQYQQRYELFYDTAGRHYMIKKRGSPNDPVIEYIPLEDSFSVLHRIHVLNKHAGQARMRRLVKKKYVLNHLFINFYLQCCHVCNNKAGLDTVIKSEPEVTVESEITVETEPEITVEIEPTVDIDEFPQNSKTQPEKNPRRRLKKAVFLDTLDLTKEPDGSFKKVFVYFNRDTSFVLIRPLLTKCSFEVAMEILKIITGFGAPNYFLIVPIQRVFYETVMENLTKLGLTCKIPLKDKLTNRMINIHYKYMAHIKLNLYHWMLQNETKNWATGCHLVQMKLNNRKESLQRLTLNKDFNFEFEEPPHSLVFRTLNNLAEINNDSDSDEIKETDAAFRKEITNAKKKSKRPYEEKSLQFYSKKQPQSRKRRYLNDTSTIDIVVSDGEDNMIPRIIAEESNNICHVCNIEIANRQISCDICHKSVHIFCSELSKESNTSHTCFRCGELTRL